MSMDLTFLVDRVEKLTNPKFIKEQIGVYVETTITPTFLGLLNFLGITRGDFLQLKDLCDTGNKGAIKVMRYLELFKNKIEANIIEKITYQSDHPDIRDKHVDYKALQWVYEKQNPEIHKDTTSKTKQIKYDLSNDSGHLENSND